VALQAKAFAYHQYPANLRPRPTWKRQVMQMVIDLVIGRFPVASPTHGTIGGPGTPQETSAKPTICVKPSASRTDSTPGVITRRHYHRKEVGSFVRSQEVLRQDTALNKDGVKVV
jgi:hypothetical protein